MGVSQWIAVGSLAVAVLSLVVVLLKSLTSAAREDGKTAEVLRQVDGKLKDITDQIRDTSKTLGEVVERLGKVEESTKSAHHRIDDLRDEIHHGTPDRPAEKEKNI